MSIRGYTLSLILTVFIVSLCQSQAQAQNETLNCTDFAELLLNFDTSYLPEYLPYFMMSGKGINDLGDYIGCVNSNYTYFTISVAEPAGAPPSGVVGLCLPSDCNASSVNNTLNITASNLNASITLDVIDPTDIDYETNFMFYFTVILLSILVIFVIIGTSKSYFGLFAEEAKLSDSRTDSEYQSVDANSTLFLNQNRAPKSTIEEIIECFDLKENLSKLFNLKIADGHDQNIGILNGVRTLSFFYVIYGHEYLFRGLTAVSLDQMGLMIEEKWLVFVDSAFYAVDVFFFMSGFLVSFVMIDKARKMPLTIKNYLMVILHRYIRIMPLYIIVTLVYWKLSVYFGSGPLWSEYVEEDVNGQCDDTWYYTLIFFGNFANVAFNQGFCLSWGWYLDCDFQLFLLAPLLVWIYAKNKNWGKISTLATIVIFWIITMIVCFQDEIYLWPITGIGSPDWNWYYFVPYTKGSAYFFGLLFGMLYKEWKSTPADQQGVFIKYIINSRIFRVSISLLGVGIIAFIMWIISPLQNESEPYSWPNWLLYTWAATARAMYVGGLALFILPSLFGKNRFFTGMLNNGLFLVLARISYCGYLVHLIFLSAVPYASKGTYTVTNWSLLYDFCATLCMSLMFAVVMMMLVEYPGINLEGKFLYKRKPKVQLEKTDKESAKAIY